ncbi:MAG: ABC-F family ATP-binding cassette domain-containing protein [Elusimicrobia bacterium]|nr:ABC-F family ATP-binding cassette domain-containing protein [Elusimicrobiota bacterium]
MITIKNIHKTFGTQTLFKEAALQINAGDRFALVGPNGSGKSTLFKMLLSEQEPDLGEIQFKRGIEVGYLPQENPPISELTVVDETLAHTPDPDGRITAKAKMILMGLGFKTSDFERKVSSLSGGWAMRVAMARLLLHEPDLLMLDEPTNHLDLESMLWFQNFLLNYRGAIFLISHDRNFVNTICKVIVSVQNQTLKTYHGNYDYYLNERSQEKERLETAYQAEQRKIAEMQDFISRNRARASTASRAQSMIKRLEKLERIELPEESKKIKIRFPQPERCGVRALNLKNLYKSYGETKVYENLNFEIERGWKMAFVGHNGAGKSTLIKILSGTIPFDKGERILGLNVKVGYFSQHRTEMLHAEKTVLEEALDNKRHLPEQMVRTILGSFLFPGNAVFKKVEVLSGGEKSRLALVKILLDPPNVLLMDEPTTHLDLDSVEALIISLKEFEGTLCFISHDLYFINALANHIVHVDEGQVTLYPGNYEYFERRRKQKEEENIEN